MNIKNDPHLIEYLQVQNTRKTTKEIYVKRLKVYCKFTGKTPTQLIEEAEEDEENSIRMKKRRIKKYLINFLAYLREENRSPNYITNLIATIKSFYGEFEIELPRIRCNIRSQEELITTEDIISKKHIRQALKYCNIKYKAIILLMSSSGMGSSEMRHLTFKDFIASQNVPVKDTFDTLDIIKLLDEKRNEIGTWSIRRFKTGMPYITFNSPESTAAIIDYIHYRLENKKLFKSLDDLLFEANGHQIAQRSISAYFERLNDRCGFGFLGRQRFFRSHGLRKFFASTLKNQGMDTVDAEWLIGHKLPNVTGAYIKPDIYRLKKEYTDILPFLSLSDVETVTIESDAVKEIKETHKMEIQGIKEEQEQMKEMILKTKNLHDFFAVDKETQERYRKWKESN